MATELTWLGHGSWSLRIGNDVVLLDPFLDESPTSPVKATDVEADYILVSHGHFDHVTDAAAIAHRTEATVIANFEIAQWLAAKHHVDSTVGMNLGGQITLPFGTVKMTIAWHSSQLPDGSDGGSPGGFLLKTVDGTIYFACDTALFSDMQLDRRRRCRPGGAAHRRPVHHGPGRLDRGHQADQSRPRAAQPLQHLATDRPGCSGLGGPVREKTSAEPIVLEPGGTVSL